MKNRILLIIAFLLGFAQACEVFDGPDMYGSPPVGGDRLFFRVRGTVTDDKGQPIPNIMVGAKNSDNSTRTAHNGSFDLSGYNYLLGADLVFIDNDGLDNGGQFTNSTIWIKFTEKDRTDDNIFELTDLTFTLEKEAEE